MTISPIDFGAIPYAVDPLFDSSSAVIACLSDGRPVDGEWTQFRVTQNIRGAWKGISALSLIDDNPRANQRTLWCDGSPEDAEVSAKVEWAGSGLTGDIGSCAHVWINGSGRFFKGRFKTCGMGRGSGVAVHDAEFFDVKAKVKDSYYESPTALTDDAVQGLWLNRCRMGDGWIQARKLGGIINSGYTRRFSRGLVVSGCEDVHLGGALELLDQGVDLTGTDGNNRITATGMHVVDAYSFGFAVKMCGQWVHLNQCQATRADYAGFVVTGTLTAGQAIKPREIHITNSTAIDPGNTQWASYSPSGAIVTVGADAGYPERVCFQDFLAHDTRAAGSRKMAYGIRSQVPAFKDAATRSVGHLYAGSYGNGFDGSFSAI